MLCEAIGQSWLDVCHDDCCDLLMSSGGQVICFQQPSRTCEHEEAGTRIFVHAKHSALHCPTVIINSQDADVAVVGVYHALAIRANLLWQTGTKLRWQIVTLSEILQPR